MTKTQLKKRWKDEGFVKSLGIPLDKIPSESNLQNIDLRGVPKLGNDEPLWHFKIHKVNSCNIDLSYGDGALILYRSNVSKLICKEFTFDRASYFINSTFHESDFTKAKFKLDLSDCEFVNCIFDESTFLGGFNEYGFKRCVFSNCTFRSIKWEKIYLRACKFENCDFTNAQICNSIVAGFKHTSCLNLAESIFTQCDIKSIELIS